MRKICVWAMAAAAMVALLLPVIASAQFTRVVFNLELDYMEAADHDHKVDQLAIDAVVQMFACQGITLNIVLDDPLPETGDCTGGADAWNYYDTEFDHNGDPAWWYGIMAHSSCLGGGFTFLGGRWFVAAPSDDPADQARLIAHEFGHDLYLRHGGAGGSQGYNNKPNYPSVMNYRYHGRIMRQFACDGLSTEACPHFKMLDYSHGTLPSLDTGALDESAGLGFGPIDWNCNGVIDPGLVSANILGSSRCNGPVLGRRIASDHDDWTSIKQRFGDGLPVVPFARPLGEPIVCFEGAAAKTTIPIYPLSACYADTPPFKVETCDSPFGDDADGDGLPTFCDPCPDQFANTCCCEVPGDANGDGLGNLDDIPFLIAYIFQGGPAPPCLEQADVNADGVITTADVIYLNNAYLYGGPEPVCGIALAKQASTPELPGIEHSSYPNPFNPSTSIHFRLPEDAPVTLEIYNVRGERVVRLLDETMAAGPHRIDWSPGPDEGIASGTYMYRLVVGDAVFTSKMMLLK